MHRASSKQDGGEIFAPSHYCERRSTTAPRWCRRPHALQQLQTIHDEAQREKADNVTIELSAFVRIANTLQRAWEKVKTAQRTTTTEECITSMTTEESSVLSTLKKIQASISVLEQKYEDIQTKVTEAPKTYAEIIKSASSKKSKFKQQTQRRKQRETLRQERAKYGVTLTMKSMKASVQQSITDMSAKDIAERCQQAINRVYFNNADSPRIIEVSRLANSFRLQFKTEEEANTTRNLHKTKDDVWTQRQPR